MGLEGDPLECRIILNDAKIKLWKEKFPVWNHLREIIGYCFTYAWVMYGCYSWGWHWLLIWSSLHPLLHRVSTLFMYMHTYIPFSLSLFLSQSTNLNSFSPLTSLSLISLSPLSNPYVLFILSLSSLLSLFCLLFPLPFYHSASYVYLLLSRSISSKSISGYFSSCGAFMISLISLFSFLPPLVCVSLKIHQAVSRLFAPPFSGCFEKNPFVALSCEQGSEWSQCVY